MRAIRVLSGRKIVGILLCLGMFSSLTPQVKGQALLPYIPPLSGEQLEAYSVRLMQDAIQLLRIQEVDLALSRAKLAVQLSPRRYLTWFVLGTAQSQKGNHQEALAAFLEAKKIAPDNAEVLFALGNSYFQVKQYQAAVRELEAGLLINNQSPQAYFDLGNAYFKLNQYDKAINAYQQVLKLEADFWPAINNIGLVQYEQGNVKQAMDSWRKAIAIDEQQAEPLLALAVALYERGQTQEAIQLGKKALQLDPNYGNIDHLILNLWGEKLIASTRKFFQNRSIAVLLPKAN